MNHALQTLINEISPPDRAIEPALRAHLDDLTKPRGSLGQLEDIAARYCLITGNSMPPVPKKAIFTFGADHGVSREGISAYPREVTPQMVRNMLAGGAAVSVLARHAGAELHVVDIGVDDALDGAEGLLRRKIRWGTDSLAGGPAMSIAEAEKAILTGAELAWQACETGVGLMGTGEIGIGNTTASSALFAAFFGCEVEEVTGRGTGVDDAGYHHKVATIKRALKINAACLGDPLSSLAAVGGLEIAGICGCILGAAAHRCPVVVDGFISSAGALVGIELCPAVKEYLFFSHCSAEKGHRLMLDRLGVEPILDLGMRLGEGTGAALAMTVIDAAIKVYREMATFSSAGVSNRKSDE